MPRFRKLKSQVLSVLESPEWENKLESLLSFPPKQVIGALCSCLHHPPEIKWHAVTAFGMLVPRMADENMGDARTVMNRFVWNIEKDSSSTGWGIPESMGEVMACQALLAMEFHKHLISYIQSPDCRGSNYIEQSTLRQGAYWGLGRLSEARPELVAEAAPVLLQAIPKEESTSKGLICWILGLLQITQAKSVLEELISATSKIELYRDRMLAKTTVGELAKQALEAVKA